MSDCTHNCDSCNVENCSSRIEQLELNDQSCIMHTVAIVSGKGGVGKSFVTSLLASALKKAGKKVGILDGDITGPSIPKAFGIHERAYGDGNGLIYPVMAKNDVKIISSNMLLENEEDPIIWRGALVTTLLGQFYKDVVWGALEYLLIDMPPGTSDVTLTTFQSIPLDGIIIVTSPQDLVSLIVKKAVNMAKQLNVPILGIVENMSYVKCDNCGNKIYIYGKSKIEEVAKSIGTKVLCQLPIVEGNSELVDQGKVFDINLPEIKGAVDELLNMEEKL
ncbi:MAG: Mrp/NBP35 family ATP-binding protein [Erysipelotrichaceae bacterium]|jgi:Mrp family chromosome partitioning ATPase|nr:Mrp/NBP35 family ATP-binding protein [Erysipelotrichaceae bacterium]